MISLLQGERCATMGSGFKGRSKAPRDEAAQGSRRGAIHFFLHSLSMLVLGCPKFTNCWLKIIPSCITMRSAPWCHCNRSLQTGTVSGKHPLYCPPAPHREYKFQAPGIRTRFEQNHPWRLPHGGAHEHDATSPRSHLDQLKQIRNQRHFALNLWSPLGLAMVALGLGHQLLSLWLSWGQAPFSLSSHRWPDIVTTTSSYLLLFLLLLWLVHPWPCALELTMKGSSSPGSSGSFAWRGWRTLLILLSRSSSVAGPVSASVACSQAVKLAPERLGLNHPHLLRDCAIWLRLPAVSSSSFAAVANMGSFRLSAMAALLGTAWASLWRRQLLRIQWNTAHRTQSCWESRWLTMAIIHGSTDSTDTSKHQQTSEAQTNFWMA